MSSSIDLKTFLTSEPAPANDKEPITTRPRRKLSFLDRIDLLSDAVNSRMGPMLIGFAVIVMVQIFFCFFAVFLPFHYANSGQRLGLEEEEESNSKGYFLTFLWSCYLTWGVVANYYYCITTPPGSALDDISDDGTTFQDLLLEMESFSEFPQTCKRCHIPKPERTHHCSICKKCILKYDHHCPWINNCVGHFNHRYFLMFLTFVSITSVYFFYMGMEPFMYFVEYRDNGDWPYPLPRPLVALTMVLLGATGLAVGGLCFWHWYLMLTAQTTLEMYDNSYIKKVCKKKGDKFSNMYDFGIIGNLLYFLNVGRRGHYPWYTVFLPVRVPPIGNGKRFEKSGHGYVLDFDEDDRY